MITSSPWFTHWILRNFLISVWKGLLTVSSLSKGISSRPTLNFQKSKGTDKDFYPERFYFNYHFSDRKSTEVHFTKHFLSQRIIIPKFFVPNAAFRLACRSQHCRFDDDICTTAQLPLAAERWPSSNQRLANELITLLLCPPWQIAYSWLQFNSEAMPLGDKPKRRGRWELQTMKQQAVITRRSGKAASGKLVWNQHKGHYSKVFYS